MPYCIITLALFLLAIAVFPASGAARTCAALFP